MRILSKRSTFNFAKHYRIAKLFTILKGNSRYQDKACVAKIYELQMQKLENSNAKSKRHNISFHQTASVKQRKIAFLKNVDCT